MKLVQFDFPYSGPFGAEMTAAMNDLALSINSEPGFLWKIWTENADEGISGGIYAFSDEPSARAYVEKHGARLAEFGIEGIRARVFDVNQGLSRLNHAPL